MGERFRFLGDNGNDDGKTQKLPLDIPFYQHDQNEQGQSYEAIPFPPSFQRAQIAFNNLIDSNQRIGFTVSDESYNPQNKFTLNKLVAALHPNDIINFISHAFTTFKRPDENYYDGFENMNHVPLNIVLESMLRSFNCESPDELEQLLKESRITYSGVAHSAEYMKQFLRKPKFIEEEIILTASIQNFNRLVEDDKLLVQFRNTEAADQILFRYQRGMNADARGHKVYKQKNYLVPYTANDTETVMSAFEQIITARG